MTNKKELIKVSFIFFAFEHHFVKKPGSLMCKTISFQGELQYVLVAMLHLKYLK